MLYLDKFVTTHKVISQLNDFIYPAKKGFCKPYFSLILKIKIYEEHMCTYE